MQQNGTAESPAIPFPDELAHLEEVAGKVEEAYRAAEQSVQHLDQEYAASRIYMSEHRSEIDPSEMFQNERMLTQIDQRGLSAVLQREKVARLKDSPYFARIDFREQSEAEAEVFYIGRSAFDHNNQLLISDWRAPIASMFYDCEVGPAGYVAPMGDIEGELTRKRQFKIKNGRMEYALESSVNIQDNILQQELSATSDEKMKSIIATIQKEQNQIIRNERAGTLIIQGVAGSGKTSIALHRIAFLLYRFKGRLTAQNVTILSPNRVFGDYISNVLPELGEEPIFEVSLADIAAIQLEGVVAFEPDRDPLETEDAAWSARVAHKSTLDFVAQLDRFIEQLPALVFAPADYSCGRFTATADYIDARYQAYRKHPVKRRLQMIADDIYDRFHTENIRREALPSIKAILRALGGMLRHRDTLSLYREFYRQSGDRRMLVLPAKKTLEWADVYPFLCLHAAFEGLRESRVIKHLVVDEMQDYTPVQYAVLNRLFRCQKTILGDFGQFIHPSHRHTLEDLKQLYDGAEVVTLTKSYRSSYEIISFAKRIKHTEAIDAIERHGEPPAVLRCRDREDELRHIAQRIADFAQSGLVSLGIIVKTNRGARELYDLLSKEHEVRLLTPDSAVFSNGVTITSIQMAKGLEFDEVIVPQADSETYATQQDRSLLYVACTRAMHRLALLYVGQPSPFVPAQE